MSKTLYVFSSERLNNFKKSFSGKNFVSIGFIFNLAPNLKDIDNLDDNFINNCIIDITALALENGYYHIFIEQYLYRLIECFDDVEFLINNLRKNIWLERFPYIFDKINEDYVIKNDSNIEETIFQIGEDNIVPIPLLLYKQPLSNEYFDKYRIISIGSFFTGTDCFNYRFNVEEIEHVLVSQDIRYVDITQIMHIISIRKDLLLSFEIILRKIKNKKHDIQFLVCEDMEEKIKKYLPFTFCNKKKFFLPISKDMVDNYEIDNDMLQKIVESLVCKLMGHEDFKKDFSFNLKKFVLLNKMKQRKIFSIFLTGESGIGKTEFAKILSNIMYPKESIIKINFGNYSNEGVLNSLIGSPLGYIGSEEGGELINKMSLSKSKVILIDEFEKATPSVFHFFYELLEDGKFTDRHGVEHDLDGYIIVFTSNISKERYIEYIPDPLKSRFDMVYQFIGLSSEEKIRFINESAKTLITKIYENTSIKVQVDNISCKLNLIIQYNNLRSIKRKVEDIVIEEYYKEIDKK